MLIDLPHGFKMPHSLGAAFDPKNANPERLSQGIYRWHFSFANDLNGIGYLKTRYPFSDTNRYGTISDAPNEYGVCDSWEQITDKWPYLIESPRRFFIGMTPIYKDDQPKHYGWRWNKWGDYIGTKNPRREYLYDEGDDINLVWVFHIVELSDI
jgi:hypothetical protein